MNDMGNKKVKIILLALCVLIAAIAIVVIVTSGTPTENTDENVPNSNGSGIVQDEDINNVITKSEKKLDNKKANELFDNLALVYSEEFAPFTDYFMLDCAMQKVSAEEEPDYSAKHVDSVVEKIFGKGVKINKENVSSMDITKSLYYYYPDTNMYCVIPVGLDSSYKAQILKYATHDDEYTYVYTNEINGAYYLEDEKVVVVVGDKEGKDIIEYFDSYEATKDFNLWKEKYEAKLPIYKYTLKEQDKNFILISVEKVNY